MRQDQLAAHQGRLRFLELRQQELIRKTAVLKQADQFTRRAQALGLQPNKWTFYDVNVQAPLGYEAAQEMIHQCSDSEVAYFGPISLEIKVPQKEQNTPSAAMVNRGGLSDVILSVKGRFVAR